MASSGYFVWVFGLSGRLYSENHDRRVLFLPFFAERRGGWQSTRCSSLRIPGSRRDNFMDNRLHAARVRSSVKGLEKRNLPKRGLDSAVDDPTVSTIPFANSHREGSSMSPSPLRRHSALKCTRWNCAPAYPCDREEPWRVSL